MTKEPLILYGHSACPAVPTIKGMLSQTKVNYAYVNIHQDSDAAARVRAINNGNESVPTLVFPDGDTLTEPSVAELKVKLESLGYKVGIVAWALGNAWRILLAAIILFALLRFLAII